MVLDGSANGQILGKSLYPPFVPLFTVLPFCRLFNIISYDQF